MANVFDIQAIAAEIQAAKDKAVGLPLPPYPVMLPVMVEDVRKSFFDKELMVEVNKHEQVKMSLFGTPMCFPLSLKKKSASKWLDFRIEPLISLQSKNELVKRTVSKISVGQNQRRGTIKEYWAQDDYAIQIDGILTRQDEWSYPVQELQELADILTSREVLDVTCPVLQWLGITQMVVEDFSFPFTKGEENQAYSIKALSDDDWDLFIKLDS